jgi:hypothetical protein
MCWGKRVVKHNRLQSNSKSVITFNKVYVSVYWINSSFLYHYANTSIVYKKNMNIGNVLLFTLWYKFFSGISRITDRL